MGTAAVYDIDAAFFSVAACAVWHLRINKIRYAVYGNRWWISFSGDDYLKNVAVLVGWRCKCNLMSRPNNIRAGAG